MGEGWACSRKSLVGDRRSRSWEEEGSCQWSLVAVGEHSRKSLVVGEEEHSQRSWEEVGACRWSWVVGVGCIQLRSWVVGEERSRKSWGEEESCRWSWEEVGGHRRS
jgi:hypothetical protein